MYEILLVFHVLISIVLIGLILLQHGKGAQTGAAFGSGASQTVFGSQGSGGFLSRTTATLAALFFLLNIALAYLINRSTHQAVSTQAPISEKQESKENPPAGTAPSNTDVPAVE